MARVAVLAGAIAIVAISVAALIGVGASDDDDSAPLAPPPETADPLPRLPNGWTASENDSIGVAVGLPPGWSEKVAGDKTTLRAPGSTVVVSVTADRSGEALHADLTDYALRIAEDLQGETVVSIDPNSIEQPEGGPGYEVASVTANATREGDGAGRTLQVVVVRRPELAAYPMLIASGDNVDPAELRPIVNEIVASLRGRPVSPA